MFLIRGRMWSNNDPHPKERVLECFDKALKDHASIEITASEGVLLVSIKVSDTLMTPSNKFALAQVFSRHLVKENIRHVLSVEHTLRN